MKKKFKTSWLRDIGMVIGGVPPRLFELLSMMDEKGNTQSDFARESCDDILKCIKICKMALGEIRYSAANFTLHDLQHSINIIDLMGQLVKEPSKLSAIEIVFLIFSALLHDIGMVKLGSEYDISLEEIRSTHGNRSASFILNDLICDETGQPLKFGRYHLIMKQYLAIICASHMEDISYIDRLPVDLYVNGMRLNARFCAILLRLADAMDLSRNRAPYTLYNFLMLKEISSEHWKKHLSITDCFVDTDGFYRVDGTCNDESVHRALYNHLDMIESELRNAIIWMSQNNSELKLSVKSNILKRKINTYGYSIWHHTFELDFQAISALFMGEHLYKDSMVGVREIIQNSIDACMVRQECEQQKDNAFDGYTPYITISCDDDYIYIRDNGIGMTDDVIRKYFLNIGVSYYQSKEYMDLKLSYKPMGYFGIGFLACFMLSDEIWIKTSGFKDNVEYKLHLVKGDKHIAKYIIQQKHFSGTEIKLKTSNFPVSSVVDDINYAYSFCRKTNPVLDMVSRYIYQNFWKIKVAHEDKKNIQYTILAQDYESYLFEKIKNSDYRIRLSQYLDGIEGYVCFEENDSYRQLWEQSGVEYDSIFKALQAGKIELGGELKNSMPFGEKVILFDGVDISEIQRVDQIPDDYVWGLIPQYTYLEIKSNLDNYDMLDETKSRIESALYKNSWFSIFVPQDIVHFLGQSIEVQYHNMSFELFWNNSTEYVFFQQMLKEKIGTAIGYLLIKKYGGNHRPYESIFYSEKTSFIDDEIWFKSVRIGLPYLEWQWLMFEKFKYFINIKNEEISPHASRHNLTEKSNNDIVNALSIVKYIWLLEQMENTKCSEVSVNYIKNRLKKICSKKKLLLKAELKRKWLE